MSGRFDTNGPSIMRHKEGPLAWVEVNRPGLQEFFAVCVPHDTIGTRNASTQAQEVYCALASWLHEQAAMGVQERILGNLADREAILAERQRLRAILSHGRRASLRAHPATERVWRGFNYMLWPVRHARRYTTTGVYVGSSSNTKTHDMFI